MVRPRSLLLLLVLLAPPARADVQVRDEGDQGIVLSNRDALPAALPAATRAAAVPRGPGARASRAARQLAPLLRATARAHGLPEALLQAVVEAESDFDPGAVSPRGAVGLMQLMPATARALRVPDARDPGANLDGGARYLKDLLAQHDHDLVLALAAYNAGPGAVRQAGGVPPFAETRRYVPRVLARYHQLQAGGRE